MAFPSKLLNEGERVVVSTRTHVKALILPGLVVLVALAPKLAVDPGSDDPADNLLQLVAGVVGVVQHGLFQGGVDLGDDVIED